MKATWHMKGAQRRIAWIALVVCAALTQVWCAEKQEGGCEYYYGPDPEAGRFYCEDVSDQSDLSPLEEPDASGECFAGDDRHFHDGDSCNDIGYAIERDSGNYIYNENYDASPSGHWGDGAGGGSGGSCSGEYYDYFTPGDHSIYYCQAAYYECQAGNSAGVEANCDILRGFGSEDKCPYCQ